MKAHFFFVIGKGRGFDHKEGIVRVNVASVNFLDIQQRRGDLVKRRFYTEKGGLESNLPVTLGRQPRGWYY